MNLISYDVIRKPVITEKSMNEMGENKYTFIVHIKANKFQIKNAIEEIFKVEVKSVNTLKTIGKIKRQRGIQGKRADYKKAMVTLKEGNSIEFFEGMQQ